MQHLFISIWTITTDLGKIRELFFQFKLWHLPLVWVPHFAICMHVSGRVCLYYNRLVCCFPLTNGNCRAATAAQPAETWLGRRHVACPDKPQSRQAIVCHCLSPCSLFGARCSVISTPMHHIGSTCGWDGPELVAKFRNRHSFKQKTKKF